MNKIDISIVLNMHREALFLRPTLLSLEACALEAKKHNINVELLAIFDRSDELTEQVFDTTLLQGFCNIQKRHTDVGSLGLARNAGIEIAEGEFIWTADADDLVSKNSLVELYKTAKNTPNTNVVIFLDYLVAFGASYHVGRYADSRWLTAADFAYQHPYVSRIFIRKSAFNSLQYLDLKVTTGFAYEDWDFNTRLFAADFQFLIAPNTILFYRQRPNSLLKQANATSAKIIPHSQLFSPAVFGTAMKNSRKVNNNWKKFLQKREDFHHRNFVHELLASEELVSYLKDAANLDPEVELTKIENTTSYSSVPWNSKHWGFYLERFYELMGNNSFSDVILLPWLKPGGAEKYILNILQELAEIQPDSHFLVITGQHANKHEWIHLLPQNSVFIDIHNAFPTLESSEKNSLVIRALLSLPSNNTKLHIKSSGFTHDLMDKYCSVLSNHFKIVYYRFCDDIYKWNNHNLKHPSGINFLRKHFENISYLISDCNSMVKSDSLFLGNHENKYKVIYTKCLSQKITDYTKKPNYHILWASRISHQKHPELISKIFTILINIYPNIKIHVYGAIEDNYNINKLFNIKGIKYKGTFDDLDNIPTNQFDCFLYTTLFDGLPNIILESMAAGLPVIAPNIGGIAEVIIDNQTGFLIPDEADEKKLVSKYIEAISLMYENWQNTLKIARNGQNLIMEQHSNLSFKQQVINAFKIKNITGDI